MFYHFGRKYSAIDLKFSRLRTIQKYKKKLGVVTSRRSGLSAAQAAQAVDLIELDDPLGRFGSRLVQEKLRNKGVHVPRCIAVIVLTLHLDTDFTTETRS